MESPAPDVALTGSYCSVISGNTLYTYSSEAFQALPLESNGTWSQLKNGVAVTNATCVLQSTNGTDADDVLWVVGGVPASNASSSYPGLQSYTFSTQTWASVTPLVDVTQERVDHGSVYLPSLSAILVYAGSQAGPSIPSTETFLISVEPPYAVESYSCDNIPAISPLVLAWNDTFAITVGGAADNANVYLFGPTGWQTLTPSLDGPLKSADLEQATLVQGSDGSAVLELYDMSVSPNDITQIILQTGPGVPASPGQTIARREVARRELTLSSWPDYNSSLAPTVTRQGFALARSSAGLVAIAGGGDTTQSVALFNDQTNAWVNTTLFFGASADQKPIVPSASSSISSARSTASSTASSSSTSTSASSTTTSTPALFADHARTSLILGATLGCVLGIVAVLIVILLILRYRKYQLARRKQYGGRDEDEDEKDRMSFEDRGDPYMKDIAAPIYPASHDSMSVHEAEMAQDDFARNHRRSDTRGSEKSTSHLVRKNEDAFELAMIQRERMPGSAPSVASDAKSAGARSTAAMSTSSLQVPGAAQQGVKRGSGWGRYFSGAEGGAASGRNTPSKPRQPGVAASMRSSGSSAHDCSTHGATELPPLDMGKEFHEVGVSRAVTGNGGEQPPTFRPASGDRPGTVDSAFSAFAPSTAPSMWSRDGTEELTGWTPMTRNDRWNAGGGGGGKGRDTARDTATSSFYGSSVIDGFADGDSRITSGATTARASTTRMASGAHMLPKAVTEENEASQERPSLGRRPTLKVAAPPREPEQAVVQDDLSWVDLGGKG